jgi:hypothetical protein
LTTWPKAPESQGDDAYAKTPFDGTDAGMWAGVALSAVVMGCSFGLVFLMAAVGMHGP